MNWSRDSGRAEPGNGLKRGIGGICGIVGIKVVVSVVVRAVIARELRVVVALESFGELVEELNKFGGRLIGEIDRQTHKRQVVRPEHSV